MSGIIIVFIKLRTDCRNYKIFGVDSRLTGTQDNRFENNNNYGFGNHFVIKEKSLQTSKYSLKKDLYYKEYGYYFKYMTCKGLQII